MVGFPLGIVGDIAAVAVDAVAVDAAVVDAAVVDAAAPVVAET